MICQVSNCTKNLGNWNKLIYSYRFKRVMEALCTLMSSALVIRIYFCIFIRIVVNSCVLF